MAKKTGFIVSSIEYAPSPALFPRSKNVLLSFGTLTRHSLAPAIYLSAVFLFSCSVAACCSYMHTLACSAAAAAARFPRKS